MHIPQNLLSPKTLVLHSFKMLVVELQKDHKNLLLFTFACGTREVQYVRPKNSHNLGTSNSFELQNLRHHPTFAVWATYAPNASDTFVSATFFADRPPPDYEEAIIHATGTVYEY